MDQLHNSIDNRPNFLKTEIIRLVAAFEHFRWRVRAKTDGHCPFASEVETNLIY